MNEGKSKTMTVGELIQKLSEYCSDLPIYATWEGVEAYVKPDNFSVKMTKKNNQNVSYKCLYVDVEEY